MTTRRGLAKSLALLVAMAATPAIADAPRAVIEGKLARPSGRSVLLDARKSASDKPLTWKLISPAGVPFLTFDSAPRKATYLFIPDPDDGTYVVALVAVGKVGDELEADTAVVQVVVGDPAPRPPPGPGPTPDPAPGPIPTPPPDPVPAAGVAWAVLVSDLDSSGPGVAAIRSAPAIRQAADAAGIRWRSYDDDSAAVREKNLAPFVRQAGGVPALILQAGDGRVIASLPCPATPEGVVDILKKYRKAGGF